MAYRTGRHRYTLGDLDASADGPMLTVSDLVDVTGLSLSTVLDLVKAHEIRSVRFGRNRKIPWIALRVYLLAAGALPLRPRERAELLRSTSKPNRDQV